MRPFCLVALVAALPLWPQTRTYTPQPPTVEDPELRREAVRLMERAWHVSTPLRWLPHEQRLHIKAIAPSAGGPSEGDFRSIRASDSQKRFETEYGDYHFVHVSADNTQAELGSSGLAPPIVERARKLTPVFRAQFDSTDIIRAIRDATIDGHPARCIDFTTVAGEETQQNQVCVDAARGMLLSLRQDNVTLLQSQFFEYSGALFPGHFVRLVDGAEEFEIDQRVIPMTEFPAGTFEFPPGATTHTVRTCKQFIRSTAIDTPQPPIGPGQGVVDVVLRGFIDGQGHVLSPSVLESTRPDLNQTALQLVAKWTYQPARCDGNTAWWTSTFRVQFKGY
jgi:hypothetical protein